MSAKKLDWWLDPAQRVVVAVGDTIRLGDMWEDGVYAGSVGMIHLTFSYLLYRRIRRIAKTRVTVESALKRIEKRLTRKQPGSEVVANAFGRIDDALAEIRAIRKQLKGGAK